MNIDLKDILSNSFCLSIDKRRKSEFSEIFKNIFSGYPLPKIFDGYSNKDLGGKYCCELGHCSIVRMAKALSLPFVTIFEDDAYPMTNAADEIKKVITSVPDNASMLMLGYNKYNKIERINDNISKLLSWCWGSHAYILFSGAYDAYLDEYDKNTKHVADDFYGILKNVYIPNKNIFIQRNVAKSMNGYSGYIWDNKSRSKPPEGFCMFEDIIGISLDMDDIRKSTEKQGFKPNAKKCIVIGSNPSIKGMRLKDYIDGFEGDVVRINKISQDEYKEDYGTRTDVLMTCPWYEKTIVKYDFKNKILLDDGIIHHISSQFQLPNDKWLTTGMCGILMALSMYDTVELLGFGKPDVSEGATYKSLHNSKNYKMDSKDFHHDLDYEHHVLGVLSRKNFKDKLSFCELKFPK